MTIYSSFYWFNYCYWFHLFVMYASGILTGDKHCSYKAVNVDKSVRVCGMPPSVEFGPPSNIGHKKLEQILASANEISFVCELIQHLLWLVTSQRYYCWLLLGFFWLHGSLFFKHSYFCEGTDTRGHVLGLILLWLWFNILHTVTCNIVIISARLATATSTLWYSNASH